MVDFDQPQYVIERASGASHAGTAFASANGGEYRKSYHGFAYPTAYVIDSPQSLHVMPMQIDTWNRDHMNISGGSPFVPGPVPKHSLAGKGRGGPGAVPYSGILECPLTSRVQKTVQGGNGFNDTVQPALFACSSKVTACEHTVDTAASCFAAAAAQGAGKKVTTSQGASSTMPGGCSITVNATTGTVAAFFNTNTKSEACCGQGVTSLVGATESLTRLAMSIEASTATVTLTGPDQLWFGVGFFAQSMQDAPYSIIVDGHGAVTERRLVNHGPGSLLAASVNVTSNTVEGGKRTVVLTRPTVGPTKQHATFSMTQLEIPFITAIGSGAAFAYHQNKTAATLRLWPGSANEPVCLCKHPAAPFGAATGTIKYLPTGEEFGFVNYCEPEPEESVLVQRNPTCDVRSYVGGLQVCKHMWSLLDADQVASPLSFRPYFLSACTLCGTTVYTHAALCCSGVNKLHPTQPNKLR